MATPVQIQSLDTPIICYMHVHIWQLLCIYLVAIDKHQLQRAIHMTSVHTYTCSLAQPSGTSTSGTLPLVKCIYLQEAILCMNVGKATECIYIG